MPCKNNTESTILYEGKAKILKKSATPLTLIQEFKNELTAFNAEKKMTILGKGIINNLISAYLMEALSPYVPVHFLRVVSPSEQEVLSLTMLPLEVIIRNEVAGSFGKRYGLEQGKMFSSPIIEFCYKKDSLGDPFIDPSTIVALQLATEQQIDLMKKLSITINHFLLGLFYGVKLRLVDFKLEFGIRDGDQQLVLGDEITPDTCRLHDHGTGNSLDKDVFRFNKGNVLEAYTHVADRLGIDLRPYPHLSTGA